jgi:hypothetical protein
LPVPLADVDRRAELARRATAKGWPSHATMP